MLKDSMYVLFRAERELYEKFKNVCYETLGTTPSELFRAFMKSIVEGGENIVISRRPIQTSIMITQKVEQEEASLSPRELILRDQLATLTKKLDQAIRRRAPKSYIEDLREKLFSLCRSIKSLNQEEFECVKDVLDKTRSYLEGCVKQSHG